MKLTHVALALTILLFALTGYLFYQGRLDRKKVTTLETRLEESATQNAEVGDRIKAIENRVGIDSRDVSQRAKERDVLLAEQKLISERITELASDDPGASATLPDPAALAPLTDPGTIAAASDSPSALPSLAPPSNLVPEPVASDEAAGSQVAAPIKPKGPSVIMPTEPDLTPMQQKVKNAGAIGKVNHYDTEWAFAVIDAGSESGIEVGDEFSVRRNHYVIGKLKVREVNAGQAIANLVPGTLEKGMTVQQGDAIIHNPLP